MSKASTFESAFLKKAAPGLRRRPDYGARGNPSEPPKPPEPPRPPAPPLHAKAAASAPREYPVRKKEDGFWYVIVLQGEEVNEEEGGPPTVKTPDAWLDVPLEAKNLDLAEELYRALYAEFQVNDSLKEGDVFATPIGRFVCQGVDVVPQDDMARKAIAEVDERYRCECGCDQGKHRKRVSEGGGVEYGECSDHPECREYRRREASPNIPPNPRQSEV